MKPLVTLVMLLAAIAPATLLLRLLRGRRPAGEGRQDLLAPLPAPVPTQGKPAPAAARKPVAPVVSQEPDVPAAWPAGTQGALPRALGVASFTLWRRAFGVEGSALAIPPGHEFAAAALERVLAGDALGEKWFPRRPMLMPQLQAAANDPDSHPGRLASIIAQDPVLAADVLRLANSVFYRLSPEPVESLQRAVVVCGTDGLQSLAATALVQPVFRAGSHGHPRFAVVLWERCTRAASAAEACARQWCPQDRQTAQLLPLLAALGPLVAYRIVEDAYRTASHRMSSEACLALVLRHGPRIAARVASQWQMPERIAHLLAGDLPAQGPQAEALAALVKSWQAGELLATLSVLADEQQLDEDDFHRQAGHAGIPEAVSAQLWQRTQAGRDAAG